MLVGHSSVSAEELMELQGGEVLSGFSGTSQCKRRPL